MNEHESDAVVRRAHLDRRRVLRAGGGLAGLAAILGAPARADSAEPLVMDMACDGRTFRLNRRNQADGTKLPMPGDTFIVHGSLYPAGTIERGLKGPDQSGAIGRWVCGGTFLVDITTGAMPHVVTTVLHVLGTGISATAGPVERALDAIATVGFEGGAETRRGVVGGYGKYAGLRGEVVQTPAGENESLIQLTPEVAVPAPNYTFTFVFGDE